MAFARIERTGWTRFSIRDREVRSGNGYSETVPASKAKVCLIGALITDAERERSYSKLPGMCGAVDALVVVLRKDLQYAVGGTCSFQVSSLMGWNDSLGPKGVRRVKAALKRARLLLDKKEKGK